MLKRNVQAQLVWNASNVNELVSLGEACVDCARRIVGSCAALLVNLLHLTHGVCLMSAYDAIMSWMNFGVSINLSYRTTARSYQQERKVPLARPRVQGIQNGQFKFGRCPARCHLARHLPL